MFRFFSRYIGHCRVSNNQAWQQTFCEWIHTKCTENSACCGPGFNRAHNFKTNHIKIKVCWRAWGQMRHPWFSGRVQNWKGGYAYRHSNSSIMMWNPKTRDYHVTSARLWEGFTEKGCNLLLYPSPIYLKS